MVRAVTPIPFVKARFFDRCGKPLAGGKVYTYEANTTTAKTTYKDPYGLTPNTNPIILDAAGEADIYLDGTYRIRITDRNDVLVNDVAKIGSWFSDNLQDTLDNISGAMDDAIKPALQSLDNAINTAAAAGAGANGWDALLVRTASGETQQEINNSIIRTVATSSDLTNVKNPYNGQVVNVKSLAKNFVYNSALTVSENGATIVGKWEMQLQDAYYASWFCPQSSIDNVNEPQQDNIEIGYRYATSKGRSFIIDNAYYVDSISRKSANSYPALRGNDTLYYAVRVLSNSTLIFKKGVGKLKLKPNNLPYARILCIYDIENYAIFDPELIGDKDSHSGTDGEQHYMIGLHASKNGYIRNPIMRNSWGDGLYIGYAEWTASNTVNVNYPTNIIIDDIEIYNASRNGISLCGAENLTINNCLIDKVDRIAPMAGVDIEPEEDIALNGGVSMHVKNVKINNLTIKNCNNYGVMSFIQGNRDIDISFTGTTTISAKAPNFCSLPLWFCSYRGELTEGDYNASGAINFDKVIMTDNGAQWHITTPISYHSELAKIKVNIGELIHTKFISGAVSFSFDNPTQVIASWIGGLNVQKITLNNVYTVGIGSANNTATKTLKDVNLPIDTKHQIDFVNRGHKFTDNVYIGGHALVNKPIVYDVDMINNMHVIPAANPDDGNGIYAKIVVSSKDRKLSYSLSNGLTAGAIGYGLYIINDSFSKSSTTPNASMTVQVDAYPGLRVLASYGSWA